ncbi:MAG: Hypoxanthine-guanine phosphoribosyltransferase [Chlorobi bacterium]|nr:Hypoxanthine-guanine phosphoribosyltransferase [Chlorobiota bacterium]
MDEPAIGAPVMIDGLRFVPMIGSGEISRGIAAVAGALVERYRDRNPLMICVLNGAAIFHADLIRLMPIALEVDYVRVSSYDGGLSSSGTIIFTASASTQLTGRNVIVVEDIVDTGRTVDWLRGYFMERGAASVEVASLLYKREAHMMGNPPEYAAFEIPNRFVVGFGLDYRQQGRNLPAVYLLDDILPAEG